MHSPTILSNGLLFAAAVGAAVALPLVTPDEVRFMGVRQEEQAVKGSMGFPPGFPGPIARSEHSAEDDVPEGWFMGVGRSEQSWRNYWKDDGGFPAEVGHRARQVEEQGREQAQSEQGREQQQGEQQGQDHRVRQVEEQGREQAQSEQGREQQQGQEQGQQ